MGPLHGLCLRSQELTCRWSQLKAKGGTASWNHHCCMDSCGLDLLVVFILLVCMLELTKPC